MITTLTVLLAAVFGAAGIAKVAAVPAMQSAAAHLGYTKDQYRAIGALEIAGALGIAIGIKVSGIGVAAGVGLVLLMVGAAAAHLKNHDAPARIIVPFALAAVAAAYVIALV